MRFLLLLALVLAEACSNQIQPSVARRDDDIKEVVHNKSRPRTVTKTDTIREIHIDVSGLHSSPSALRPCREHRLHVAEASVLYDAILEVLCNTESSGLHDAIAKIVDDFMSGRLYESGSGTRYSLEARNRWRSRVRAENQNGYCESGWTYFKNTNSCYKTFLWATFDDAERRCESYGGHLTSIHSDDENDFIIEMSQTGYNYKRTEHRMLTWIGLKQADYPNSKDWTWTDGTNVDYLPWAPTEPNNLNGKERCAQVHSDHKAADADPFGMWNDIYCDYTMRSYVCKKMAMH